MNEELLKKLNGLVAKIKPDLIVDAVLDLGDIYAVSTREKNMNSDEMFIDGWYAADKQASKIMPFDKQKYQKKFASALKNPLWDINSAGKEIKHSMGYNLVDKNQNDGVLAHASKYAGGFTKDGDNTPEYNHNYYIENREKILAKRRQRRDTEKTQASGSKPSVKPTPAPSNFVHTNRGERPISNGVRKTRGASRTRSGGATRSVSNGPDRVSTRNAQVENYVASTKKHRTPTNSLSDIEKAKKAKKKSGIENAKKFINGLLQKAGKTAEDVGKAVGSGAKALYKKTEKARKTAKYIGEMATGTHEPVYYSQDLHGKRRIYRDKSDLARDIKSGEVMSYTAGKLYGKGTYLEKTQKQYNKGWDEPYLDKYINEQAEKNLRHYKAELLRERRRNEKRNRKAAENNRYLK